MMKLAALVSLVSLAALAENTPASQELCYLDTGTTPVQNYNITYIQQ